MNVTALQWLLQGEHDETTTRAACLREQIDQLTSAPAEAAARLAEIATTRKVVDSLTPADHEPPAEEPATVYQRIVTTFNEHPGHVLPVHDLHELLALPHRRALNQRHRSRLGRLARQGFLEQPGRGRYRKRPNVPSRDERTHTIERRA